MQKFFALTTRGLEAVSAQELTAIDSVVVSEVSYRRIAGYCQESPLLLLGLRTVDDVFLEAARWTQIGHTRNMLSRFRRLSQQLELRPIAAVCASLRFINPSPSFSVTASFVGRRNYSANEIKSAVAAGVMSNYSWSYNDDDRAADFNIRVFIEHETAFVGVRLGKAPLHERPYKRVQRPGSLKPPVAAAMLVLAGVKPGASVLDPCCGVGTILIEAHQMGAVTWGGDIAREAVDAAQLNAAGTSARITRWDARKLPLAGSSADCVITNLPWGRQVAVNASLAQFYAEICAEITRVLKPGGHAVALSDQPELLAFPGLRLEKSAKISLFGQTPTIAVFASTRQTTHPHSAPDAPAG